MGEMTLNLPIRAETQKKLKAYAMLTDRNVSQIESQLADLLDQVLTQECFALLGGEAAMPRAAREETTPGPAAAVFATAPPKPRKKKKSFAAAHKEVNANPVEEQEAFAGLKDEVSGHELSGDRDDGGTKSLEDQYAEAQAKKAARGGEDTGLEGFFEDDGVPDVGENAEAFLDAAMGTEVEEEEEPLPPPSRKSRTIREEPPTNRTATKSFETRLKKGHTASVQPMTGDED